MTHRGFLSPTFSTYLFTREKNCAHCAPPRPPPTVHRNLKRPLVFSQFFHIKINSVLSNPPLSRKFNTQSQSCAAAEKLKLSL